MPRLKRTEIEEIQAEEPVLVKARAARITIVVELSDSAETRVIEIPDFKGSVMGSQFKPRTVSEVIKSALVSRFGGQLNELSSGG